MTSRQFMLPAGASQAEHGHHVDALLTVHFDERSLHNHPVAFRAAVPSSKLSTSRKSTDTNWLIDASSPAVLRVCWPSPMPKSHARKKKAHKRVLAFPNPFARPISFSS